MKKLRLLLSISCLLSTVSAQSDLIRPGSIGQPTATPSCEFSANNQPPATCWVGQKIIFLPRPKSLQGYGYQSFSGGTGQFGNVSYNEGVGKIATIIEVKDGQYSGYEVKVKIDSSDKIYTGKTYGDKTQPASIDGVAFIREIQDARTNLTGKTVWLSVDSVATYDNSTGKISNINVKKFQPLKIEDVVAGWYSETPIQLIIRLPDGREAFTNISYYGWNAGSLKQRFAFERSVFLEDPKTLHKWTENI